MDDYLKLYREMIALRGLTYHTQISYVTYTCAHLIYLDSFLFKKPADVSWQELCDYIIWLKSKRGLPDRTINSCISQLRFFTMYVLHKPWDQTQLPMRRFDQFLPYVPLQKDTFTFISTMPDLKQKAMLAVLYSAGLRVGELCALRYEDIDRQNMWIHIRHTKAHCDRYAMLSTMALDLLTQYWYHYDKPRGWLFPKQTNKDSSRPLDTFYLSRHIHEHERRLGWEEKLTCHSFRHGFGTHLYENGADLLTIKSLLGHKSLASTMIYVHLASNGCGKAVSPLDFLAGEHHV